MTFAPDMNVHFIFEDNNRSQPSNKFDEKEKDSDISRNANDQPYYLDDKTESDALSCESKDPGKFDSVIKSAVKEPKFLVFFVPVVAIRILSHMFKKNNNYQSYTCKCKDQVFYESYSYTRAQPTVKNTGTRNILLTGANFFFWKCLYFLNEKLYKFISFS